MMQKVEGKDSKKSRLLFLHVEHGFIEFLFYLKHGKKAKQRNYNLWLKGNMTSYLKYRIEL